MSQADKSALWRELKDAGVQLNAPYREYTTEQLETAVGELRERLSAAEAPEPVGGPAPEIIFPETLTKPVVEKDTVAGLRVNTHDPDEPIRIEEDGRIVYQDEVRKSAFPKPRGRRVLEYNDPGVKKVTVRAGEYTETVEMPGDRQRTAQAKITLPSYQVGIYRDPRFPMFKVHEYNDQRGFDFFDVNDFYGGAEGVPVECKRVYVENSLCYDMRSVIRAIQTEYRERVLPREMAATQ